MIKRPSLCSMDCVWSLIQKQFLVPIKNQFISETKQQTEINNRTYHIQNNRDRDPSFQITFWYTCPGRSQALNRIHRCVTPWAVCSRAGICICLRGLQHQHFEHVNPPRFSLITIKYGRHFIYVHSMIIKLWTVWGLLSRWHHREHVGVRMPGWNIQFVRGSTHWVSFCCRVYF